jgi:hypothetical protein
LLPKCIGILKYLIEDLIKNGSSTRVRDGVLSLLSCAVSFEGLFTALVEVAADRAGAATMRFKFVVLFE